MSELRNQLKATPVVNIKNQEKEVKSIVYSNDRERQTYLSIEAGMNKFRIFPAHNGSDTFVYPYSRWWIEREIQYTKDDGTEVNEVKKKPVWNARIHGGVKKDVVEEYVKFVSKLILDEYSDEKLAKEQIAKLTHWKTGLNCKHDWVAWAKKISGTASEFGLWTFSNAVKNKLNDLTIMDESDDVISTDPFTDVDSGKAVIIKYDDGKNTQPSDRYKANIDFNKDYSLSDAEITEFMKQEGLKKMFSRNYKRRDFDLAVKSLQYFDKINKYGAFDLPEWIQIVEELQSEWPEETEEQNETELSTASVSKSEVKTSGDEFDSLDRTALKKYIIQNELSITPKTSMSDDDLRNLIRQELNEQKTEVPESPSAEKLKDIRSQLGI